MAIGISNIAWDIKYDEAMVDILRANDMDSIDIAPSKYFSDLSNVSDSELLKLKKWWLDRGIKITGMQSLLFGRSDLNIFGTKEVRRMMLDYLGKVCKIGAGLNANLLVFGSPKNRDLKNLEISEGKTIAIEFFKELAGIASNSGVEICLEPNPSIYGSNFMCTSDETAEIVYAVDRASVLMQLDTGAMAMNKEIASEVIMKYNNIIGHIHISEPKLKPIGTEETDHSNICRAIKKYLPNHPMTIEMLSNPEDENFESIKAALEFTKSYYN